MKIRRAAIRHFYAVKSREYPTFPIAATATTVVLKAPAKGAAKFLLIQRANDPGKGLWSLPGGSISTGESTVAAAARELFEETAPGERDVRFIQAPFTSTDAIYRDDSGKVRFHYVISQCIALAEPGALKRARAGDDASDLGWFTLEEMESSGLEVVPVMLDVARRASSFLDKGDIDAV